MSPQVTSSSLPQQKLNVLQIVLLASLLVVCGFGFVSSTAQAPPKEEREFEDKTPQHLPIKFKVKNPDKVKNLQNENWLHDLEIEVTNSSDKPIYFLAFGVIMPEVKSDTGHDMGFILRYGRIELVDYTAPLKPSDAPIQPGESYTFKIPEQNLRGWERFATKRNLPKSGPKKIQLIFNQLNFGDGTGYQALDGKPVNIHEEQSLNGSCRKALSDTDLISTELVPRKLAATKFI